MEIKIWGARGSRPVSGASHLVYGGGTSCVEVRLASGQSFLFDAGSGIAALDETAPKESRPGVICFTHAHFDHVQGLPFYSGMFNRRATLLIYGPEHDGGNRFEDALASLFDGVHMPIRWEDLPGHQVRGVKPGETLNMGSYILETCPTIHPGGNIAWKITADGATFAYTGDHEIPLDDSNAKKSAVNDRLMRFLAGSDVVLADCYFTDEDRRQRSGNGHSSPGQWQKALAGLGVGKLLLGNFNPAYDDKKIAALEKEAQKGPLACAAVFDGCVVDEKGSLEEAGSAECPACDFSRKVASFSDTHSILSALLDHSRKLARAEAGTIYLLSGGELRFSAAQNDVLFPASASNKFTYFNARLPLNKTSIAGYAAATGKILNIPDVRELPKDAEYSFNPSLDVTTGYVTKSVLAVPLVNGSGKTVGVLQLINHQGLKGCGPFSEKNEREIATLCQLATIPLERSFLVIAMIIRILRTAALRDPSETTAHVARVGGIAAELYHHWAEKRNVDPEEILFTKGQLRLAAMLHDVGKVGVPDAILRKPGRLTPEERVIMERHACLGAGLFENSLHVIDKMARDIAMHHHARWDGKGYTGRKDVPSPGGEAIPLWARITAIADVYDALMSERVYKNAWTADRALQHLRQEAGSHFDPDLIHDFMEINDLVRSIAERYPEEKK